MINIENSWIFMSVFLVFALFIIRKLHLKYILPNMLPIFMKKLHDAIEERKKSIFKEALENIEIKKNGYYEILEIGVGSGENFRHFPKDSNVNVIDKCDDFLPYLKESFQKNGREDLKLSNLIVSKGECMTEVKSNSMDIVVHTFILCSVDDPSKVLAEIYRVLKPGGVCIFIEHSLDKKNLLRRTIQTVIGPLWYFLADCKFISMQEIVSLKGKYDSIVIKEMNNFKQFLTNPIIFGFGKKNI